MNFQSREKRTLRALRSIALFEAFKGAMVIAVGFGLLSLVHRDLQAWGEELIRHLRMNPARQTPQIFLHALAHLNHNEIRWLALGALLYSGLRFLEAYGLWRDRAWAEWLAIVSTGVYLPVEFYDLWKKITVVRICITLFNLGILLYLVFVRRAKMKEELFQAT